MSEAMYERFVDAVDALNRMNAGIVRASRALEGYPCVVFSSGVPVVDTAGRVALYVPSSSVENTRQEFEVLDRAPVVTGVLSSGDLALLREGVIRVAPLARRIVGDAVWAPRKNDKPRPVLVRLRDGLPAEGLAAYIAQGHLGTPAGRKYVALIPEGERQPLDALHRLAYTEAAAALHDGRCHDVLDVAKQWERERDQASVEQFGPMVELEPFTSFGEYRNSGAFKAFIEASERQVLKETLRLLCMPAQYEFRPTAQTWSVMNKPVERPAPFTMPNGWTFGDLVAGRPRLTAEQWETLPLGAFFAHTGERCVYSKGEYVHHLAWKHDGRTSSIFGSLMKEAVKGELVQVGELPAVANVPAVEPESTGWFASGKDADGVGVYGVSSSYRPGGWPDYED